MKKYFLTGLALFLPVILTLAIVAFFVNLLTDPFINAIEGIINYYQLDGNKIDYLSKNVTLILMIRICILIFVFSFIILVGYLTSTFFLYSIIKRMEEFIQRIPVVNKVYKALQEVIHNLFSTSKTSFKQVVLVPYPNDKTLSIGFVTSEFASLSSADILKNKIAVFVPGTPNPTFGFILIYSKDQITFIDMKVEEAFKLLISCGIMLPANKKL